MSRLNPYASFESAYHDLNEAIFISSKHEIVWCNQHAAELLGYDTPEEIIGTNDLKHLAPMQHVEAEKRKESLFGGGVPQDGVFRLNRKDGSQIVCSVRASLLCRSSEHLMMLIPRIISVKDQDLLTKHCVDLFKHRINSPLSVIMGTTYLIQSNFFDQIPTEVLEYLNIITENVTLIDKINKSPI